jgi:hypothetical protein
VTELHVGSDWGVEVGVGNAVGLTSAVGVGIGVGVGSGFSVGEGTGVGVASGVSVGEGSTVAVEDCSGVWGVPSGELQEARNTTRRIPITSRKRLLRRIIRPFLHTSIIVWDSCQGRRKYNCYMSMPSQFLRWSVPWLRDGFTNVTRSSHQ